MAGKLEGRVAIITGSGSGMGKAIASLYASEGAIVMIADFNESAINETVKEITDAGGKASGFVADMSKENDIIDLVQATVERYDHVDILVNNAGILDNFRTVTNTSTNDWNRVLAVNLNGPYMASREVINVMLDQPDGGVIINTASVGGLFGVRGGAAYTASKHGIIGLTQNIAGTYGIYNNIRANAIAPGGVETNLTNTIKDPDELGMKAISALGPSPMGKPEEIAKVALFLASDDSSFVNGAVVTVDGGLTAS